MIDVEINISTKAEIDSDAGSIHLTLSSNWGTEVKIMARFAISRPNPRATSVNATAMQGTMRLEVIFQIRYE
jgi:hypothetical protein